MNISRKTFCYILGGILGTTGFVSTIYFLVRQANLTTTDKVDDQPTTSVFDAQEGVDLITNAKKLKLIHIEVAITLLNKLGRFDNIDWKKIDWEELLEKPVAIEKIYKLLDSCALDENKGKSQCSDLENKILEILQNTDSSLPELIDTDEISDSQDLKKIVEEKKNIDKKKTLNLIQILKKDGGESTKDWNDLLRNLEQFYSNN